MHHQYLLVINSYTDYNKIHISPIWFDILLRKSASYEYK